MKFKDQTYVEENNDISDDEEYSDEEVAENEDAEIQEPEQKPQHRDAEESVSSTRKTASASLEELMKMMEEEQQN